MLRQLRRRQKDLELAHVRRQQKDLELAHDMSEIIKRIHAGKQRMRKQANEDEVANIFRDQSFSDEDVKMGPRNTGWKTVAKETKVVPGGMIIEKTTRVRSFGRMKKTAFFRGFTNEIEKKGMTLVELIMALGVSGVSGVGGYRIGGAPGAVLAPVGTIAGGLAGGGIGMFAGGLGGALLGRKIDQWAKGRRKKKRWQTKMASLLDKFANRLRSKMVIEPTPKKSTILEKNPFLRIEAKRRLVSGRGRILDIPKARGLLSGSAQFANITGKEAS